MRANTNFKEIRQKHTKLTINLNLPLRHPIDFCWWFLVYTRQTVFVLLVPLTIVSEMNYLQQPNILQQVI